MSNVSKLEQIYKARKVLLELMVTRGYDVTKYQGFSETEVNAMMQNQQLDMVFEKEGEKTYIRHLIGQTLRPQHIFDLVDELYSDEDGILNQGDILFTVTDNPPNNSMILALKQLWEREVPVHVVTKSLNEIQFNVLNHKLVPPHRICGEIEKQQVRDKYNIKDDTQFPDISRFDPVASAICAKPNDLIEILRPSKSAVTTKYYRMCRNMAPIDLTV